MKVSSDTHTFKILVVTSCTKSKVIASDCPANAVLTSKDLWDERKDNRAARHYGDLERYRLPAGQLYRGVQHQEIIRGVELLRNVFGPQAVEVKIISAGFGLVDEHQLIPPYEATFAGVAPSKVRTVSKLLGIPSSVCALLAGSYSCAFFLLGEGYLRSLGLPYLDSPAFPCLFLVSPSNQKYVPQGAAHHMIQVDESDVHAFGSGMIGIKGRLFRIFAQQIVSSSSLNEAPLDDTVLASASEQLAHFIRNPTSQCFQEILRPLSRTSKDSQMTHPSIIQAPLFLFPTETDSVPPARNIGKLMRYFIPDWDDLVDPGFHFETDTPTPGKKKYVDEVYAHQIYDKPSYDGLLFSKSTIEDSPSKAALVKAQKIHQFARFSGQVIGDCGAFGYITKEKPPYSTQEILDYYEAAGFDYGVSIDHLIIPAFYQVREDRYRITRENAHEFMQKYRAGAYSFVPIGVAQGWSPETYRAAVIELLEWGYQYIALGGLARSQTSQILDILKAVAPVLTPKTDLHLFGVARDREGEEMKLFHRLGVTSFDSASYLRRAWMSATDNYFTEDGGRYAAVRISPVSSSSPRVKQIVSDGVATVEQLQKLERDALLAIRDYDRGALDIETTLSVILEIDRLEEYNYERHQTLYRKVLEDMPWKKCPCAICQQIGVEVIIFRMNDRNRRRGFHNTHVFYNRLQRLFQS